MFSGDFNGKRTSHCPLFKWGGAAGVLARSASWNIAPLEYDSNIALLEHDRESRYRETKCGSHQAARPFGKGGHGGFALG
jgi:uncharacterized low-complexity protein